MNLVLDQDAEDIAEARKSGRPLRPHGPYRIEFGNEHLDYRPGLVRDPVPTGRQLLDAAGARPVEEHILLQLLTDGLLEEIRLDETTDLRGKAIERFLVFRSDRSFRFELDGRQLEWGATVISGVTLKTLAGVDPKTYGVWLEVRGDDDRSIGDAELVDLAAKGVERFFTGIVQTTEG